MSTQSGRLQGKIAIVTGATSGIGFATAKRLVQEGACVLVTGRRQDEVEDAVHALGYGTRGFTGDVSKLADLDRLYALVREEFGGIDILIASAGSGEFKALSEITEEHYERTFSTNVKGTLFTVQKALPLLRDGASVILTGSTAAVRGLPFVSVYCASKAAIRSFARAWISELAPRRIRVNILALGATSTPEWHGLVSSEEHGSEMQRHAKAATRLGQLADPAEIANVALFLASDESSFVNGGVLYADGGSAQI
jgi:NAD(P)-dependent dehydrogenase (short-subunit alcohol dehydrogenase family)